MTETAITPPPHYNDLGQILLAAQELLTRAAVDRTAPMRNACVASHTGLQFPSARVMIVRDFDPGMRTMTFFTDQRTPKVEQIEKNGNISLVLFDPIARVQMRIDATARVIAGERLARNVWDTLPTTARRDYMADQAPAFISSEPTSGLPQNLSHTNVNVKLTDKAFDNFAMIVVTFRALDWLYLADTGNRRARFEWKVEDREFLAPAQSVWLVP